MSDTNTMTYYSPMAISPYSAMAGLICQEVADSAKECGYPMCHGEVVGAAVHEAKLKEGKECKDGAQFLPVCEKHKRWEYAKLSNENIAWSID